MWNTLFWSFIILSLEKIRYSYNMVFSLLHSNHQPMLGSSLSWGEHSPLSRSPSPPAHRGSEGIWVWKHHIWQSGPVSDPLPCWAPRRLAVCWLMWTGQMVSVALLLPIKDLRQGDTWSYFQHHPSHRLAARTDRQTDRQNVCVPETTECEGVSTAIGPGTQKEAEVAPSASF